MALLIFFSWLFLTSLPQFFPSLRSNVSDEQVIQGVCIGMVCNRGFIGEAEEPGSSFRAEGKWKMEDSSSNYVRRAGERAVLGLERKTNTPEPK